jgi:subtilisin family serine protease
VDILDGKYFSMSGTSQSAAVVSGSVALLLQQNAQPRRTT